MLFRSEASLNSENACSSSFGEGRWVESLNASNIVKASVQHTTSPSAQGTWLPAEIAAMHPTPRFLPLISRCTGTLQRATGCAADRTARLLTDPSTAGVTSDVTPWTG